MRAFVETVNANGLSAAARVLDVPRSKVSKQILALEDAIGVQLLVRTTRSLSLTAAGAQYYEASRHLLSSLDEADQRARDVVAQLKGILRINAPASFGVRILAPLLPKFHRTHPNVEFQVALSDPPTECARATTFRCGLGHWSIQRLPHVRSCRLLACS